MSVVVVKSAALVGVEAYPVDVEVSLTQAIPGLKTIGLPDTALREGKERVLLALRNAKLIEARPAAVVNLAPAEVRKTGARYELPIAAGLLAAKEIAPRESLSGLMIVGELGLRGDVRLVRGTLAMAVLARALGARAMVVPEGNAREASLVDGLEVYSVGSLRALCDGLRGEPPFVAYQPIACEVGRAESCLPPPDFADVRGQAESRRAAEIAAAGGHNLLIIWTIASGAATLC